MSPPVILDRWASGILWGKELVVVVMMMIFWCIRLLSWIFETEPHPHDNRTKDMQPVSRYWPLTRRPSLSIFFSLHPPPAGRTSEHNKDTYAGNYFPLSLPVALSLSSSTTSSLSALDHFFSSSILSITLFFPLILSLPHLPLPSLALSPLLPACLRWGD